MVPCSPSARREESVQKKSDLTKTVAQRIVHHTQLRDLPVTLDRFAEAKLAVSIVTHGEHSVIRGQHRKMVISSTELTHVSA
jgi:hypothetical protein